MEQAALFFDSWEEALRDDVRALGGSKKIGQLLYPEKDVESAARTLNDKLNSGRRERLTDEQERMIIRMAGENRGHSAALHFLCDDTRFERTKPITPEESATRLQREFVDNIARGERILEEFKRLTKSPLQAIK